MPCASNCFEFNFRVSVDISLLWDCPTSREPLAFLCHVHAATPACNTIMSDEVSDFLRSVELLKGRREEEDEARSRELEEKILQEKRERQARRAGTN